MRHPLVISLLCLTLILARGWPEPLAPGQGYMAWQSAYGWAEPDIDSQPAADPDGDGFANLAEYRSGADPLNPADRPEQSIYLVQRDGTGYCIVELSERISSTDVREDIEVSRDLLTWQTVRLTPALQEALDAKNGIRRMRFQIPYAAETT